VAFICGLLIAAWYFQTQLQKNNSTTLSPGPSAAAHIDKIIVGTDPTLQPMEYIAEGKFVGYDIDLANSLGKELGAKVEFKNIVFDNLFTALEQKKIDMIISAVTITEERKQKYKFSDPYLNAGQVIIGKIDDDSVKSTADLKGKKIAVQKGTTNEESALKYTASNLVIRYPDFEQATQALVDGKVDAIFTDLPSAKGITVTNPTLKIASDPFTDEYYGIVFRKDESMVKQVNDALTSLRIKGTLTDLKQKWLD
ncbi:MAG TPA: basic amino acid ABC transporter substrate-binding protein, partial [Xanthomonadales bacterium]|nr:basic amino acid ABC transporter substrate-binding protein [Xanthomonadales bacterium]